MRKTLYFSFQLLVFGSFLVCAAPKVSGEDQAQFGQAWSRNMVSAQTNLPDTFDPQTGKNIKWIVNLGTQCYASPVIANGKVLISTNNDKPRDDKYKGDRGVLYCLNENDGSLAWQLVVPKLKDDPYKDWPHIGMTSPATIQNNRAYIVTNRNQILCLDLNGLHDGNDGPFTDEAKLLSDPDGPPLKLSNTDADILWVCDLIKELEIIPHDSAYSSILMHGRYLYINSNSGLDSKHDKIRNTQAPCLIVVDKTNGRIVAMDDEIIGSNIFHSTWSSPCSGNVNGKEIIFFGGPDGIVYGFEPVKNLPPAGTIQKLKRIMKFDCDPNGLRGKIRAIHKKRSKGPSTIKSMPVLVNNRLYVTAGGDVWWGKRQSWLKCIDATQTGDATNSALHWSVELNKHCISTPSVYHGMVFVADSAGYVHCIDSQTGKTYWAHQADGEIWASTFVADSKVYIGTRRHNFWILAADQQFKVLHKIKLDSPVIGTAVAANGTLYVTTMKKLYALEKK